AAVIFSKLIGYFRPRLKALPRWTQYLQPSAAGFLIGVIGFFGAPQVMGAGYQYIDQAMHGQFAWKFLALLALLKIISTTLAYVISRTLQHTPIFDLFTRQDGLILPSLEEDRDQAVLRIEDAMKPHIAPVLHGDDTIYQAANRIGHSPEEIFLVQMTPTGW